MSTDIGREAATDREELSPRRRATRRRLLDAARHVVVERGVAGTSVEEICEGAGFTRGAFYSNFRDKDDIITALISREVERIVGAIERASSEPVDAPPEAESGADLVPVLDTFFRLSPFEDDFYVLHAELTLHLVRTRETDGPLAQAVLHYREAVARGLGEAFARVGRESRVPVGDLTEILAALVSASHVEALLGDEEMDHRLARTTLPVVLGALTRRRDVTPG